MTVRIGILGMGFMGNCHFNAYQSLQGGRVVALCDSDRNRMRDDAGVAGNIGGGGGKKNLAGIKIYTDPARLLADPQVDVVDITLPTYLHAEWTIKALRAGKHVICEKPMARSSGEAKKMLAAAKQARGKLFVAHCIRFWPSYETARAIIRKNKYGQVLSAVFVRISPNPTWSWNNWLSASKLSGNAAFDLHIHDTDFVLHVFGKPKAVCSHGAGLVRSGFEHIITAYDFGKTPVVIAEGGWGYAEGFPFSMTFRIVMEKATLALQADGKLMLYQSGRKPAEIAVPAGDGYGRELDHFIDCIACDRKSDVVSPESAMLSVKLVEAELKSAAAGEKVQFK